MWYGQRQKYWEWKKMKVEEWSIKELNWKWKYLLLLAFLYFGWSTFHEEQSNLEVLISRSIQYVSFLLTLILLLTLTFLFTLSWHSTTLHVSLCSIYLIVKPLEDLYMIDIVLFLYQFYWLLTVKADYIYNYYMILWAIHFTKDC